MSHTIAAVSTGNQVSAIGIIRMTGDDCIAVADKVFTLNNKKSLSQIPDRKLMLGDIHNKLGRAIDSCCVLISRGPHSYTGEDTVEFHCHGSPLCWPLLWKVCIWPAPCLQSGVSSPSGHS